MQIIIENEVSKIYLSDKLKFWLSLKVFTHPGSNNYTYNFRKSKNIGLIPEGHREELYRPRAPVPGRLSETDGRVTEGHR